MIFQTGLISGLQIAAVCQFFSEGYLVGELSENKIRSVQLETKYYTYLHMLVV